MRSPVHKSQSVAKILSDNSMRCKMRALPSALEMILVTVYPDGRKVMSGQPNPPRLDSGYSWHLRKAAERAARRAAKKTEIANG